VLFWDASSLVPLLIDERETNRMEEIFEADSSIATWWGTKVECASAVRRRERTGELSSMDAMQSLALLEDLASGWTEAEPTNGIRSMAVRLLAVHALTAADSLQLAAALDWAARSRGEARLISLDERLKEAASREGLVCP
jgi:predicted nucleic acid-binding protein